MVKSADKKVFLRNSEGETFPFDAAELQTRVFGAFLAAGMREESSMAEDIVLALEYTLLTSPRPEPVFSQGEVDSAVIRTLEGVGFPDVAAAFRSNAPEQVMRISVAFPVLERLYLSHLGCSTGRAAEVAEIVSEKLSAIKIGSASPHLLLEMGRHYERELAANDVAGIVPVPTVPEAALSREDIYALLPEDAVKLVDAGVLRINGITALFPSVRFFFFMRRFAAERAWSIPATELEILPQLYGAGDILETVRKAIVDRLALAEEPPCSLSLPDISDFLQEYVGCEKTSGLAAELASALTAGLQCELYNLSLDGK